MTASSTETELDPSVVATMRQAAAGCAAAALAIGVLLVLGWCTGAENLKSFLPGHVTAKPNAALANVMAALALLLEGGKAAWTRRGKRVLAVLVGLVGGLTCLEWMAGWDLGIDTLWLAEAPGAVETVSPARMPLVTALELVLLAGAVLMDEAGVRWSHRLASAGLCVAGVALLGYTYGADALYAFGAGTHVSFPVAMSLSLLFLAVLLRRPHAGWMASIAGLYAGGAMLRRAVPFAVVAPWLMGWIAISGSQAGFYGDSTNQVLTTGPLTLLSLVFLFRGATALNELDLKERERRQEIEGLNRELESRVERRTEELLVSHEALRLSENRYRSLVEATAQIVWTTDPLGQVTCDMPMWRAFTAQSEEQIRGWGWLEAVHPDDRAGTRECWTSALQTCGQYETEYRIRRHDGEYRHVWVRGVPVTDPGGEIREWVGTCTDITERKTIEDDLRRQAELLHLAPAAILVRDLEGRIRFWSRGAERLYGWRAEEVVGRTMHDVLRTRFSSPLATIQELVLSGRVWQGGLEHARRDGQKVVVGSLWALQRDAQGGAAGFLEINVDISELKRAEQELRRLNRALRALNRCTDALVRASDEAGLLQQVCDIIVEVGGYPLGWAGYAEEDRDRTVRPVAIAGLGADYVRQARITWADTERGQGPTGTAIRSGRPCYIGNVAEDPRFTPWRESAGRHGYASVLAVPLKQGDRSFGALNIYAPEPDAFDEEERELMVELASNLSQGILSFRMRAERDRIEDELRRLNESLEHRVEERTAELDGAMRDLESFTYSVSHDLRAPLRHIDGFSEVLLDRYGGMLDEEGRHYLERVRQGTQRMGRLIDDLLKLSRIGRAELRCEPVDLNGVVREVLEELAGETAGRSIEWQIGCLPVADCDGGLVRQVFFNLLSNAVKFTRGHDPALIEIGCEGGEIFVRDNGAGFDPRYADKLFGVFQRLHRVEDFEGTGVGLATVRRIVRKHGGEVRATAAPEHGAAFHFTLAGADASPGAATEVCHAA